MGRVEITPAFSILILFLFLFSFLSISPVRATNFDVKVKYYGSFEDYYNGGEYIFLVTEIKPKTTLDGKKLDGIEYELISGLQDCGVVVEINLTSGKTLLHPTPDDYYQRGNNLTVLRFFLPDFGKTGVRFINIKVYGYAPEINERLREIPLIKVIADEDVIAEKNITVVNKHRFYSDIKRLKGEACSEDETKKLDEALSLYYDEEFKDANEKIKEVEKSIVECKFKEKKKDLEDRVDDLRQELSEIRRNLTTIEVKLQINRDKIENFKALSLQSVNLSREYDKIDKTLDEIRDKIYDDKFDEAEKMLNSVKKDIQKLKENVTHLLLEIQKSERSEELDWMWITVIAIVIGVVAAVGIALLRSRGGGL